MQTLKRYYINVKFEKYGTYTFEARSKEHAIEMYNDGDYGWSDYSDDWLSPELLIRRLVYADRSYAFTKPKNDNKEFYHKIISKNFDEPEKILDYVFKNMVHRKSERNVLLFNHPEFLKA